jgi:hypothetical protein
MKHLRRIFENNEGDIKVINDCLLDILDNSNFEVTLTHFPEVEAYIDLLLRIELGKNLSLPQPVSSNLYLGMVKTDLEFLKNKNKAMLELFDDIEVAIERLKDRFNYCEFEIKSNRREQMDINIKIK